MINSLPVSDGPVSYVSRSLCTQRPKTSERDLNNKGVGLVVGIEGIDRVIQREV